jgi:hypothetical protein
MEQIDMFGAACGGDATVLATMSPPARALALTRPRWIPYPQGVKAIETLGRLIDAPRSHRPHCLLIHGDSNMGKTVIGDRFANERNRGRRDTTGELCHQVIRVECPPWADFGALIGFILRKMSVPLPTTCRLARRIEQLVMAIPAVGVKMLIVDDIHNILSGRHDQRSIFLNGLKYLSNELQLPIVLIGDITALRTIQTDQQLGNRFEPYHLPRWRADEEYALFLAQCWTAMEIGDAGAFRSKRFVTRFHMMSEGLTGESWKLICRAAEHALVTGREIVDDGILDAVTWVRPSERRKG